MAGTLSSYAGCALTERIATAGGAAVWRGRRDADGVPVLVKVTPPARAPAARLRREHDLLQRLHVAGLARPLGYAAGPWGAALALASFAGDPLERRLAEHRFTVPESLRIGVGLARILDGLHSAGVVDGDLGPSAILVGDDGDVCVIDIGLAADDAAADRDWAYLAPEQTGHLRRAVDPRTDLYALGIVLYRLLTGDLPFHARDPLEWAHCHVARQPRPPAEVRRDLPAVVSELVMRLLAKQPEDRYQTARGLGHDLDRCLQAWESTGTVARFALGSRDLPDRFAISDAVYGRDEELARLIAAFERVAATGEPGRVVITGGAGLGKTALGRRLRAEVEARHGAFLAGAFEARGPQIPYAPIAAAFGGHIQQLLIGRDDEIARIRRRVARAVGDNGALISAVVPELEQLLGPQPPVAERPEPDARLRFFLVFRRFVAALAGPDQPLALFLDDLQDADAGSLALIAQLTADAPVRHLLIVLARRGDGHDGASIALGPLGLDALGQLVADALQCAPDEAAPLAALVERKTAGNPLHARQLLHALHRSGAITRDITGAWRYDLDRAAEATATDDVVDLLIERIAGLDAPTRELLRWAAGLGPEVALDTLALACGRNAVDVAAELAPALRDGFLVAVRRRDGAAADGVVYRWSHERVLQAAYRRVPAETRPQLHLRIARALRGQLASAPGALFEIVHQFDGAATALIDPDERLEAAALFLAAGRAARATSAHAIARHYLAAGQQLLDASAWDQRHDLAWPLHLERAEAELLCGHADVARALLESLRGRSRSRLEFAAVEQQLLQAYLTQGAIAEAVACERAGLSILGVDLPARPTWDDVAAARARVERRVGGRPIESLADLPSLTDPDAEAALRIRSPSFFADACFYCLRTARMVELCLEHGNGDQAAFWYGTYGLVLTGYLGEPLAARPYLTAAMALANRPGRTTDRSAVLFLASVVRSWIDPLEDAVAIAHAGFEAGVEHGDPVSGSYCAALGSAFAFGCGHALDAVEARAATYLAFATQVEQRDAIGTITVHRQLARCLRGRTRDGGLGDDDFDPAGFEAALAGRNPTLQFWYWSVLLRARFFLGDVAGALAAGRAAEPLRWSGAGLWGLRELYVYDALARAAALAGAPVDERAALRAGLDERLAQLAKWMASYPAGFAHAHALVAAEIARLDGRDADAARLYDESLRAARAAGLVHEEALAFELAAGFHRGQGLVTLADTYLREAAAAYARWGADGVLRRLEARHPELAAARVSIAPPTPAASLDFLAVAQASQALSREIVPDRLLDTLMRVIVEHAGARRGWLLLVEGGGLVLAAEARDDGGELRVELHRRRDRAAPPLPWPLLDAALRRRESVVGGAGTGARSSLCLPVLRQGAPIAVLYLENDLVDDAFTSDRRLALELLTAQAAISLDNAVLYEELERENADRRRAESERSRLLSQVETERAKLSAILDLMPTPMLLLEPGTARVLFSNRAAETAHSTSFPKYGAGSGFPWTDPLGRVLADDEMPDVRAARGETLSSLEVDWHLPSGKRSLLISSQTLLDRDGRPDVVVVASQDVTRLKQVEEQFRQSQKMEAIGLLAAGVAHDFNNLLCVITGYGQVIKRQTAADDGRRGDVDQILRAAERAAALTRQLLAFSRRQVLESRAVDLNALVADTDRMLRRLLREDIELRLHAAPDLGTVRVDPAQVQQVILNLAVNARDAMPTGGTLALATGNADVAVDTTGGRDIVKPGRYVMLAVSDTGCGMDPAVRAHIFEPFFTTKPMGEGTGLGLATVYGIVKQSGGHISVYSEPGRGTTFRIYFPRVDEATEAAAAPPSEQELRGSETILVVEDQEALRTVIRRCLEDFGYRVLEAAAGDDALELARDSDVAIDVLLTDVIMPRMSGIELAARLGAVRPGLRAVYMSGHTYDVVERRGLLSDGAALIEKPFTPQSLARKLREAIGRA